MLEVFCLNNAGGKGKLVYYLFLYYFETLLENAVFSPFKEFSDSQ